MGCNHLSLPEIPASGNKVLIWWTILKIQFSVAFNTQNLCIFGEISFKFFSWWFHWVSIGSGNGLVLTGNMPLPVPFLTEIYDVVSRQQWFNEIYMYFNIYSHSFLFFYWFIFYFCFDICIHWPTHQVVFIIVIASYNAELNINIPLVTGGWVTIRERFFCEFKIWFLAQFPRPQLVVHAVYHQKCCSWCGQLDVKYGGKVDISVDEIFLFKLFFLGFFSVCVPNIYFNIFEYLSTLDLLSFDKSDL